MIGRSPFGSIVGGILSDGATEGDSEVMTLKIIPCPASQCLLQTNVYCPGIVNGYTAGGCKDIGIKLGFEVDPGLHVPSTL